MPWRRVTIRRSRGVGDLKQFEKRVRALETAAGIDPPKPWRSVIIDIGETAGEVFEREGIGPEDQVICNIIYPGRPLISNDGIHCGIGTRDDTIEAVRERNARVPCRPATPS